MTWKNTEHRYGSLSISLHWLMVLLLIGVYACIELHGNFPKGSEMRDLLKHWHFMLGLTVFFLVWLRLLARLIAPTPKIVPAVPKWQAIPAHLMHFALYALMIGTPLAGWLMFSAFDNPVPFYGLELPHLLDKNQELGKQIKYWHELAGTTGYWLIGLHALAGIAHHYLVRDNTLTRMLPQRNQS